MSSKVFGALLVAGFAVFCVAAQQSKQQHQQRTSGEPQPNQVINGRLTGFDMPQDWKLAERAKELTYTNPFIQNLAARWVDGEIVYRVSFGEVKVEAASAKVAKEYIPVYRAPGPGDPPTRVQRVPEQLAIYDTKPGDQRYSPIWHYHYVVVPQDYKPNKLRSEKAVLQSGYEVVPVNHFSN